MVVEVEGMQAPRWLLLMRILIQLLVVRLVMWHDWTPVRWKRLEGGVPCSLTLIEPVTGP